MLSEDVLEKIVNMIKSININLSIIEEISKKILNNQVVDKDYSTFNLPVEWLKEENKKMADIYNQEKLKNNDEYKYLGLIINKIDFFVNNFRIDDLELDKKILGIQNTNNELLKKLKPTTYDFYIENLRKISSMLENLIRNGFLDDEKIDVQKLKQYNKTLKEYHKLLEQIGVVIAELSTTDGVALKNLLEVNYQKVNDIFKNILLNILDNDSICLVDMDKYSKIENLINNEDYDYILDRNIMDFEITNGDIRNYLSSSIKNVANRLYEIFDIYKSKKIDKTKVQIDYALDDGTKTPNYDIDLIPFINYEYGKKREEALKKIENKAYDLEQKHSKEGNLTVGVLRKLKQIKEKIEQEKSKKNLIVSKFQLLGKVKKGKLQRNNVFQNIKINKGRHFK